MATPELITVPTSSCAASVIMTLTRVVGVTASPFTLSEQTFRWPGEAWSLDFQLPVIKGRATASDWITFGIKAEGRFNYFLLGDPSAKEPRGLATGTPVVNGGGQTGNVIVTDGWTPSITGILLKGDYIQIGTGTTARLYMITEDVNSDGSGNATLPIAPALRYSPIDNQAIVVSEPKGLFRMMENSWSWSVLPGQLYRLSFQAVEVINA